MDKTIVTALLLPVILFCLFFTNRQERAQAPLVVTPFSGISLRMTRSESLSGPAGENERRVTQRYEKGAIWVCEVVMALVYRQSGPVNYVGAKVAALVHYSELPKRYNLR